MKWLKAIEYVGNLSAHILEFVLAIPFLKKNVWKPTRRALTPVTVACLKAAANLAVVCGIYLTLAGVFVWARFNQEAAKELATSVAIAYIAYVIYMASKQPTPAIEQSWPEA